MKTALVIGILLLSSWAAADEGEIVIDLEHWSTPEVKCLPPDVPEITQTIRQGVEPGWNLQETSEPVRFDRVGVIMELRRAAQNGQDYVFVWLVDAKLLIAVSDDPYGHSRPMWMDPGVLIRLREAPGIPHGGIIRKEPAQSCRWQRVDAPST